MQLSVDVPGFLPGFYEWDFTIIYTKTYIFALAVWYTSDFVAPTQTAKTILLDFNCWESSWPTSFLHMMRHVTSNTTGEM